MERHPQTFTKAERITSKLLVDRLFEGGGASFVAFPFRIVYMVIPRGEVPASILISVPKKRFHHAVDRNHMKRQVREAYRRQKHQLWNTADKLDVSVAIAFISLAQQNQSSAQVSKSINKALRIITAKINEKAAEATTAEATN